MPDCPEHEKLGAVIRESQTIGEFIDWLMNTRGGVLAKHHQHDESCERPCGFYDGQLMPLYRRGDSWLAEYFGIDEAKLEAEKKAMLAALREAS